MMVDFDQLVAHVVARIGNSRLIGRVTDDDKCIFIHRVFNHIRGVQKKSEGRLGRSDRENIFFRIGCPQDFRKAALGSVGIGIRSHMSMYNDRVI